MSAVRGGRFVQCGHFVDKGGSTEADVRTFWCKKLRIFDNLWGVHTDRGDGGGNDPVRTFFG